MKPGKFYLYLHPNAQWLKAARPCHPAEVDGPFPVLVTWSRYEEILAWAKRLPGWKDGLLVARDAREVMLAEARALYATGRYSKTQVASRFPLNFNEMMRVLRDVDSHNAA